MHIETFQVQLKNNVALGFKKNLIAIKKPPRIQVENRLR